MLTIGRAVARIHPINAGADTRELVFGWIYIMVDIEKEIRDAFKEVARKSQDSDLEEMIAAYRAIGVRFAPEFAQDPYHSLQLQRRVAESVFMESTCYDCDLDVIAGYFAELVRLGFDDPFREATYTIPYLNEMIFHGGCSFAQALTVVNGLLNRLSNSARWQITGIKACNKFIKRRGKLNRPLD